MKKLLLLASIICLIIPAFAQLEVKSSGRVYIGNVDDSLFTVIPQNVDTIPVLNLYGPFGMNGPGSRIAFGDNLGIYSMNVQIGELGTTDCDRLWLHGKHGFSFTRNNMASDTIFYFNDNKDDKIHFNYNAIMPSLYLPSDESFKENIESITDAPSVRQLNPVQYNMKSFCSNNANLDFEPSSEKEIVDKQFYSEYYNQGKDKNLKFGLIAQELEEIFPNLVYTDENGKKYIDYIGLIPLLIRETNELYEKIEILEGESKPKKLKENTSSVINSTFEDAYLSQNRPNPFSSSTIIDYKLPENTTNAQICFYDLQGKFIRKYNLDVKSKENSLQIPAYDFNEGMYLYALIVDGQEMDVKRMIVSK